MNPASLREYRKRKLLRDGGELLAVCQVIFALFGFALPLAELVKRDPETSPGLLTWLKPEPCPDPLARRVRCWCSDSFLGSCDPTPGYGSPQPLPWSEA